MRLLVSYAFFLFTFVFISFCNAQDSLSSGTKLIDYYLVNTQNTKADSVLKKQIEYYKSKSAIDSLFIYPYYVGKLSLLKNKKSKAIKDAELFTSKIINGNSSNETKYRTYINLADFYDEVSENKKSLEVTKSAINFALKSKTTTPEDIGKVRYNIGASYLNVGEVEKAKNFFIAGLKDYESYNKTNPNSLSDANNAVGATMWMSAKLDSAKYYYTNAIKAVKNIKGDSIENIYLVTIIKSNISLLEHSQGKLSDAIKTQKNVIANYQIVIDNIIDENIKVKAEKYQLRAISNLATFYNEYGDFSRANTLISYALNKNKQTSNKNNPAIASTQIQLGQSELSLKNYNKAITHLLLGLEKFAQISGGNIYWEAAGNHALAEAYYAKNNIKEAKIHYNKADVLFKKSLGDSYDKEFLLFLNNKALFLANNKEKIEAIKTAKLAYNYVNKNNIDESFSLLKHIQNLAEVYYISEDYLKAQEWAQKGSDFISKNIKNSTTVLDSIKLSFNKPTLLLLETKASYQLLTKKKTEELLKLTYKLDEGLLILENRKATVYNQEDINLLISDYKNLSDFSKKIHIDLFKLTNDQNFLDKAIELNESSIYSRIRSRLNLKNDIAFANLPPKIIEREKALKKTMSSSLGDSKSIDDFFTAQNNWNIFRDSLKINYPKYYKMRYATIEESLDSLQTKIPDNTTVIRYLFIDTKLYAFWVNKTDKNLYELESTNLTASISALNEEQNNVSKMSTLYYNLYQQLWQPFETKIETENVVIIPDAELFNLSFETLTSTPIQSFSELATNSLLSKYNISYNYSLLLLNETKKTINYKNDFIAFAPEFNDEMKSNYQLAISDSISLDKTYLNLLPQPFSVDLVKEYSKLFKGSSFLNDKATKQVFTNEANEHKIIHIGTHAESNNISPELSRLIFAKNSNNDNNSLYTYEIYNQNLNSQLAILTACETGKPTYQSGEGMISLAHAFNYAGSESILTSLWKIDEQSSTEILKYFYTNLSDGLPKNQALKEAKLDYLASAQGRTIAPQYWAGLVLIGDTSPIKLDASSNIILWLFGVLAVIILFYFLKKSRN